MPLFDVFCYDCQEENETYGEHDNLKCPHCGSKNIKRLWTVGYWWHKDPYNIHGSTPGMRARAREITRIETEKVNDKYYG